MDRDEFVLHERASRDTIDVKRVYIDMAGDLVSGILLSQIVYWHLPNREGKSRLMIEIDGRKWLAKKRTDWWEECRITERQADRALALLENKGLIETSLHKFAGAPTKHVRINWEHFLAAYDAAIHDTSEPSPGGEMNLTQSVKSRIHPHGKMRLPLGVRTSTESTTETPFRDMEEDPWQKTLQELELQLPRTTFDTWVKPTVAYRENGYWCVVCVNEYAREWLANRLHNTLQRTLAAVLEDPGVELQFVLPEERKDP